MTSSVAVEARSAGQSPRGAARRAAILQAALRVVGREGAAALTHRAVAAEAGVPLAATTYYFASKDELLREAFALAVADDVAALRRAAEELGRDGATVAGLADWLIALMTARLRDERATLLVQYALELEAARRPELRDLAGAWSAAYVAAVAPTLAALGSPDPTLDGWVVVTSLCGMELEGLAAGTSETAETIQTAVERLVGALIAPAGHT